MSKILVTGGVGFIGAAVCAYLMWGENCKVCALDRWRVGDMPPLVRERFWDAEVMSNEVRRLRRLPVAKYRYARVDMADKARLQAFLRREEPDVIVHLAARPGVLGAVANPADTIRGNNVVLANLLECCRELPLRHLLVASSSSVYGGMVDRLETAALPEPINAYAASKIMDEQLARLFARETGVSVTALRFFTVYGPLGREDMAVHKMLTAMHRRTPFEVRGDGGSRRSWTYVDDVADAVCALVDKPPFDVVGTPFRAVNVGFAESESVNAVLAEVQKAARRRIEVVRAPYNAAEVHETRANCALLRELTGEVPETDLAEGIAQTVAWFDEFRPLPRWVPAWVVRLGFAVFSSDDKKAP